MARKKQRTNQDKEKKEGSKEERLKKIRNKLNKIQQIRASTFAYFSELSLFSAPPEFSVSARPDPYVFAVYIPPGHQLWYELFGIAPKSEGVVFNTQEISEKPVMLDTDEKKKSFDDLLHHYTFRLPLSFAWSRLKDEQGKFKILTFRRDKETKDISIKLDSRTYLRNLDYVLIPFDNYNNKAGLVTDEWTEE